MVQHWERMGKNELKKKKVIYMNKVDDVMSARGWPAIKWEDGGRLLERG